jgi:tetratricopeptide (TPR) repeat protein
MKTTRLSVSLAVIFATSVTSSLTSQELSHIEGLGSLSFPNSGAAEAQEPFLRGVLLLHSFEYAYAADAFKEAQVLDPDFGLAYWGEAMTYNHPVWDQKNVDAAGAALNRYAPTRQARAAKAPTDRERAYLHTIDVLYGDGNKPTLDTAYTAAMKDLAETYPDDMEAQTFYALSLLGLSQGNRNIPTYMEAGALALAEFKKNPDHPGAAHYTIHSFDDPTHAILAMPAARAYGPIAPNAGHALHMTTHIFLARGLWDEVVDVNLQADLVADRNRTTHGQPTTDCGHYNEWLLYGYQQQGRHQAASDLLMACYGQSAGSAGTSYVYMRNLYLADTRDWNGAPANSEIEFAGAPMNSRLQQAWGNGMVAINRGDVASAEKNLAFLTDNGRRNGMEYVSSYVPVWHGTLKATILAHQGRPGPARDAASAAAEAEAALPLDFGPPVAFKPGRELEGELLLLTEEPLQAIRAFEMQLARTPNRILSLIGLARSAVLADRPDLAARTYQTVLNLLAGAPTPTPELVEARTYLRNSPTGGSE